MMENPQAKIWQVYPTLPPEIGEELKEFAPLLRQLLYNRGITSAEDARSFLQAKTARSTDPFLLKGMPAAVERVWAAVDNQEPIAIYGDYDVDGVTSTVLLVEFLTAAGAQVLPYIPNRFEEGYGVNSDALASLSQEGVRLVITVDCGVRSPVEVDAARALGLDVIITDHHAPAPDRKLPAAAAVINQRQVGDTYPDKDLAGVGLAFKLAQALLQARPTPGLRAEDWLDLVALGTVADMAPLTGENRQLVAMGLELIHASRRQGLTSLAAVAGISDMGKIGTYEIGFQLAPRLNAAGRLESALDAFHLLRERRSEETGLLAQKLDAQNTERQVITRQIQEDAGRLAFAEQQDPLILFAFDAGFNEGVIGLAAARLVESYYRPAVVGSRKDGVVRASCRSIPEFHITEALDECKDLLVRHGGHKVAAGLTVTNENLPELVARLQAIAARQLQGAALRPVLQADYELDLKWLEGLPRVTRLMALIAQLQPVGFGNPGAAFISRGLKVSSYRTVGRDRSHLKLSVTSDGVTMDAIAFRQGHWAAQMPAKVDLFYSLEWNEFNDTKKPQMNVRDLRPSEIA
jgi:single-stranded-DNA-specific exonuclease